jgi:fructokinase
MLHPYALGTGLVALDVVVNLNSQQPPRCYAGGTCGNVLTILSYLGWDSSAISRLSQSPATDLLLADLRGRKVSTKFVTVESTGSTPIIIQRISRSATGEPYHTFSWRCPGCGSYLPGYKPVLVSAAQQLASRLQEPQVFFFDRVSRGALDLAKVSNDLGALIVFEPSGIGDPKLFREAWSLAHVIKYSHERLRDIADLELRQSDHIGVLLEIETLGPDGLRYRSRLPKIATNGWQPVDALKPPAFKDAAGAGDWCTAGILSRLAHRGLAGFRRTTSEKLQEALRYGQALAAWNCGFEGARGGMYHVDNRTFKRQVDAILTGAKATPATVTAVEPFVAEFLKSLCPACNQADFAAPRRTRRNGAPSRH